MSFTAVLVEPQFSQWTGDPLGWALVYPNERVYIEPLGGVSIKSAPRGAIRLVLVRPDEGRTPVCRIDLADPDRGLARPIFYRWRWLEAHPTAGLRTGLGLTVFGRGWDRDLTGDVNLYAAAAGRIVDCPPSAINLVEIRAQIEGC